MALTLVLGPANSAKAGEVFRGYRLAAARDALLVVPTALDAEHYERELCTEGLLLGKAMTFAALIEEIAERAGLAAEVINARQRERLLRQVIGAVRLQRLAESAGSPGFVRASARLIAALGQARVGAPRLTRALRDWSDSAAASGGDERAPDLYADEIVTIYRSYLAELERRGWRDPEQFGWDALDALRQRPDRWGRTEVFVYGFDDFTAIELDAIKTLANAAGAAVTVSVTYEPGREALAARAGVVEDLRAHAELVRQLEPLDDYYEPASRASLHHLERELFAPDAQPLDPGDAVRLIEAQGETAEAESVAERVAQALAAGSPPAQIVVVCRSLARSGALLEQTLGDRSIAVSSARRIPVGHTALGRGVLALLRLAIAGGRRIEVEDLLGYLRTPGVACELEQVDALAARLTRSGTTTLEAGTAQRIAKTPPTSIAIAATERLRSAREPGRQLSLEVLGMLSNGSQAKGELPTGGDELDARAGGAILAAVAENSAIDRSLGDLLDLLSSTTVRVRPGADENAVLIAEPLTIRARRFQHVLVTGLCVGEFPAPGATSSEPFLGEDGRQALAKQSGVVLAAPEDWQARERYLLYSAISRASAQVTLSYRASDEAGEPLSPSPFLDDLQQVLGDAWRATPHVVSAGDYDPRPAPGQATIEPPDPAAAWTLSDGAMAHVRHAQLLSASALETYAHCPVNWLIEQQLRLRDLTPDDDPLARGNCMHRLLERTFRELGEPLTEQNLERALAILAAHAADSDLDPAPGQPPAIKSARMQAISADLSRYLHHEAVHTNGWRVVASEQRFGDGEESALPTLTFGEDHFQLRGTIDRIDVSPDGRAAIVRDYKSGQIGSDYAQGSWLEHDRLQVALYMLAVRRLLGLKPVAGLYQPLSGDDLRARGAVSAAIDAPGRLLKNDRLDADELELLLDSVEARAAELARQLASGYLQPHPERCTGGRAGCRHPEICWSER